MSDSTEKPNRISKNLTRETEIIIEENATFSDSHLCCSWNRICDVLGDKQKNFIVNLRPLREHLIKVQQSLRSFQFELERAIKTKNSTQETAQMIKIAVQKINKLTTHTTLNIPPEENMFLRQVSCDLAILCRGVEEVALYAPEFVRHSSYGDIKEKEEACKEDSEKQDSMDNAFNNLTDEHWLKENIQENCSNIEKLLKFIDNKTERRWWLKDVINFLKLFIKLALFVSATISVAYHEEQIASIITLIITLIQGIVEILDQYFLKHTKLDEIKQSVITTLTGLDPKK